MSYNFIPSFHYDNPDTKLSDEWCNKVVQYYYHHTNNKHLLWGKNVDEIEQYATGNIDMKPYRKMYKSIKDKPNMNNGDPYDIAEKMHFEPLPLIPTKLNSAISTMQKIPVEIWCRAIDALAVRKKKEDLEFLKNKPMLEAELQPLADQMNIGKVDLGTTKYSSIPFSDSPYGLDLNEPDELQIFVDLLYNLSVEASFETVLQTFYEMKNVLQFRLLETTDQYKYGVSSHRAFESAITGMPDIEYDYPGSVYVPHSDLPDYSDRTHDYKMMNPTVMDMFNHFKDEICTEEKLTAIINEEKYGYCACNNQKPCNTANFNTFKVKLAHFAVKSVDWVGVRRVEDTEHYEFTFDGDCERKFYAQNTYHFYWLVGTKYFFKKDKLGFATRKKGQETYQSFERSIYRSQAKSAVELAIPQNKVAQVAFIKGQHAILKSLPHGKTIDLKGMRGALEGLKDEQSGFTMLSLIEMAIEENNMIIDTEGFEGKNDGQLKPTYDNIGGLRGIVREYDEIIYNADLRISQLTGINPQLTGQSANAEGLIGLQKLLINSSINSINYVKEAITTQYQKAFNVWAYILKERIGSSKEVKQAITNMIGSQKVSIIDGLSDLPLHSIGIQIGFTQREEERAKYEQKVARLVQLGVLSVADEYMLEGISNPKDRMALLAVKEKQFRKREERIRMENFENQQQLIQQQGQNQVQAVAAETDSDIQKIYAKGDVESKIRTLSNELGLKEKQLEGLIKRSLQQERGIDQMNKAIRTIETKENAKNQESLI